jgi:hypothetical protein
MLVEVSLATRDTRWTLTDLYVCTGLQPPTRGVSERARKLLWAAATWQCAAGWCQCCSVVAGGAQLAVVWFVQLNRDRGGREGLRRCCWTR